MITKALEGWLAAGLDVDASMPRLSAYVAHRKIQNTYWYLSATDALLGTASDMFGTYALVAPMSRAGATFQEMLESWFLSWLMGHRGLSPQTVASYRDSFRLLLRWLGGAWSWAGGRDV